MNRPLSLFLFLLCFHQALSAIPPEVLYDFPELIEELGYPYEEHIITTSDGYKLRYFRIQKGSEIQESGLPVALIYHGLLDSADAMILNHPDQAPALILAAAGYDVWLGNSRGNKYGLGHTSYDSSDSNSKFWDFSWEQMSRYDLPAGMKYIAQKTGKKVNYLGHSQGNLIMFAALARRDETVIENLGKFIALAPVAFLTFSGSPIVQVATVAQLGTLNKAYGELINNKKFGFQDDNSKKANALACTLLLPACLIRLALLSNSRPDIDNYDRLVIIQGHFPAGTSVRNINHYQQMKNSGNTLKTYNYGAVIDLSKIEEPVYMFSGKYDQLASPLDVRNLKERLRNVAFFEEYELGHSSFVYGKYVSNYFQDVLDILAGII